MLPDTEFLRTLIDQQAAPLRRYVSRLLPGDPYRVQDIVQETLLRAWQHSEALRGQETSRPWLFRVARNLVFDSFRRAAARPAEVESGQADEVDAHAVDGLDNVLDRMLVRQALRPLSPRHREVLVQLYYLGRTQAEVAELLGIAQGTVKSRAFYAAAQARHALGELAS